MRPRMRMRMRLRSKRTLMRRIVGMLATTVVLAGAILCLCARLGALNMPFDLLNTLLLPTVIAMAIASQIALFGSIRTGVVLSAVTVAIGAWQVAAVLADVAPRARAMQSTANTHGAELRIIAINAFRDNPRPRLLRALIEARNPDIVMIEEGDVAAGGETQRTLPAFHRVVSCARPPCSLTILSRWPMRRIATPMPGEPRLPDVLIAEVDRPPHKLDVVAIHLPRGYTRRATHHRALVIRALQQRLTASIPMIAGGDFNQPTGSFALAEFPRATGLRRADRWIATYPANLALPAFAAIDHMFVTSDFAVRGCRRLPFTGSDHFGIECVIVPASPG